MMMGSEFKRDARCRSKATIITTKGRATFPDSHNGVLLRKTCHHHYNCYYLSLSHSACAKTDWRDTSRQPQLPPKKPNKAGSSYCTCTQYLTAASFPRVLSTLYIPPPDLNPFHHHLSPSTQLEKKVLSLLSLLSRWFSIHIPSFALQSLLCAVL